ncbi:MAG: mercuric reductase [Acidobacteria bacterium]|nr:mercuric reductase [Acidobacteriota bacterium]
MDAHNSALLANVHPADWQNPQPRARYNLVVIGAGTAGLVAAAGAAGLGAKVALVERALLGGDCLNTGCVPSKALIRAARAAAEMNFVRALGGSAERAPDFPTVMERLRALRARMSRHDSAARFSSLGVDVFIGSAQFASPQAVKVSAQSGVHRLNFSRAVIATGARAVIPPIPGLAEAGYYTNETIFNLTELPRRLIVIGSGPIGCELAQAFARLGATVTLVEKSAQFLPREDAAAAAVLLDALHHDGVDVRLRTSVERVTVEGGEKRVQVASHGVVDVLAADAILVGVGRAPNVDGLGLNAAGVKYDRANGIAVDDALRTSNARIYAAGDVCLLHKFTHTADAAARMVIQNALFTVGPLGRRKWSDVIIPWCTYTDPEIARVGLDEKQAAARGVAIDTFKVAMSDVDRAVLDADAASASNRPAGFLKINVRRGTDEILGATLVSSHAGESISEITLAITQRIGLGRLSGVIHPYPTQAEAIRKCADAYRRTRLTPGVKALFERWLRWRR